MVKSKSKYRRDDAPLPPVEDYVVAESVDSAADELSLAPPDGQTPEEAARRLATPPDLNVPSLAEEPSELKPAALRFSLLEMLAATTFISIACGAATWLELETLVGIAGFCTLLLIVLFFVFAEPESRISKLAWWTLIGAYLVSAAIALVRTFVL